MSASHEKPAFKSIQIPGASRRSLQVFGRWTGGSSTWPDARGRKKNTNIPKGVCWFQIDLLCKFNWLKAKSEKQSYASYTSKGATVPARVPSAWVVVALWDGFCSTSLVSISPWQIPDNAGNPIAEWSRWRLKDLTISLVDAFWMVSWYLSSIILHNIKNNQKHRSRSNENKKNDIFCIHSTNAFSFSNKHLLSWRISPEIRTCPKEQIAGICVEDMCMVCVCVLTCMRPLCLFELWKQASCKFKCKLPKSETIKMNPSPNLRVLSVWTGVGSSSRNFRRLACHNSEVMTKSIGISGIESGWGFLVLRLMGYSTRPYCANIINM